MVGFPQASGTEPMSLTRQCLDKGILKADSTGFSFSLSVIMRRQDVISSGKSVVREGIMGGKMMRKKARASAQDESSTGKLL